MSVHFPPFARDRDDEAETPQDAGPERGDSAETEAGVEGGWTDGTRFTVLADLFVQRAALLDAGDIKAARVLSATIDKLLGTVAPSAEVIDLATARARRTGTR